MLQSSGMAAVCPMLVVLHVSKALAPRMYRNFRQGIYLSFSYEENLDRFPVQSGKEMLTKAMMLFLEAVLPLPSTDILVAVAVTLFQARMVFSMGVLKPKGECTSLLRGFRRVMPVRSVVELIKALIKITILGWVAYDFLKGRMREPAVLMEGSVEGALIFTGNMVIPLVDAVGVAFVFLAVLDYTYQRWEYEKNLRMSKQEVKEEYKQTEGDSRIKGKIRERQRQVASGCMVQNAPEADAIIRSSTHYAVASGYNSSQNRAPMVLVEEADHLALKIVEVGRANGIYVLEDKPLARGLYASAEVDMKTPEGYYQAVIGIFAFVYKLSRRDV